MTVEKLIEELMKVEDKSKMVYCDVDSYILEAVEEVYEDVCEVFIR